jgi:hypothetical protein
MQLTNFPSSNGHDRTLPIPISPFCQEHRKKLLPSAKPSLPNHTPRYHPTIPSLHLYMGERCDKHARSLAPGFNALLTVLLGLGLDPVLTCYKEPLRI